MVVGGIRGELVSGGDSTCVNDLNSKPGAKLTVVEKGGIVYLVLERPIEEMRGIARGTRVKGVIGRWTSTSIS